MRRGGVWSGARRDSGTLAGVSQTGGSARYQRSMAGMIGAMLVTVGLILAFVLLRSLTREEGAVEREPVDYLDAVSQLQDVGRRPVHPVRLPAGWTATSIDVVPGDDPAWGMGVLTGDGRFVGLRQEDESVGDLLEVHVDEDAREDGTVEVAGSVARTWTAYVDDGGDHAYATQVGEETVLVYGSAPVAQIESFLATLTR